MKKSLKYSILLGLTLGLVACGKAQESKKEDTPKEDKIIKVASQAPPMTDIVVVAKEEAKKDGWDIELVQVTDNIQYNEMLKSKEVDANFAQHKPYMMKFNQEKDANLVVIQPIYNAKVGYYSKDYKSVDEIPEKAKIAIPSDVSNEGRALAILNEQGLITLKEGVGFNGTLKDIEKNPKELEFLSVDLLNLAEAYNEKDVAMVYNYPAYIAKVGLTPDDAILLENTVDERFAISLVAREDNEKSEKIQALKKAMTSKAVKEYIEKEHSKTAIPAF